jgi:hypothetical protein
VSRFIQLFHIIVLILEFVWNHTIWISFICIFISVPLDVLFARDVAQSLSGNKTHASVRGKVAGYRSLFCDFRSLWNIWWIWVFTNAPRSSFILIIWIFQILDINLIQWNRIGLLLIWNPIEYLPRSWWGCSFILLALLLLIF